MERRLLFLGDIHRNFNLVKYYVKSYDITNADIIQVGDFGVGFKKIDRDMEELKRVNNTLSINNVTLYAIRGNHDYKPYFDNDPFNLSNIKLVKDYSVLSLSNHKILLMGGAISVDRVERIEGYRTGKYKYRNWWSDESFELDIDKLKDVKDVDIVVTHSAPEFCHPMNTEGFGFLVDSKSKNDEYLKTDLLTERKLITDAFDIIQENNNITHHYYGHFHNSAFREINGVKHRLLNIEELWEER